MAYRGEKPACLLVCSSHPKGVSAQSFIHAFTLTSSTFNIYLATPDGKTIDFVDVNEGNRQWLAEFKSKPMSKPHLLENMDGTQFLALVIPSCPGALYDLASSPFMAGILKTFMAEKKLMCAVGYGVAALFASTDKTWGLANYSLTAPSTEEVARRDDFATLPVVPSDFIRQHGATYSSSKWGEVHVVVDSHVVTGQNEQSTLTAVQNLILISNARLTSRERQ